jgi:hypothetical protein
MDLNIDNYNTDELCQILELNINNITPELLKNNLLVKIKLIETVNVSEIQINKVDLINFYVNSYFKLISTLNHNKQTDNSVSKLDEIIYRLSSITNTITNTKLRENNVEQRPHYTIQDLGNKAVNVYNQTIKKGSINPIYRQTLKKYININTRFRDNYIHTNSNNFIVNIPTQLNKVLSIRLFDHDMPFVVHSISDNYNNNRFKIIQSSSEKLIIIDPGSYTYTAIVSEINKKIIDVMNTDDIQLRFIKHLGFMNFYSKSDTSFNLDFFFNDFECINNGTNNRNDTINSHLTLGWILGFRGQYISSNYNNALKNMDQKKNQKKTCEIVNGKKIDNCVEFLEKPRANDISTIYIDNFSYTSEGIFDPHFNTYFLLSINDFMNNHDNIFISPFKYSSVANQNILARISSTTHNTNNIINPERVYFGPTNINKLEIKLYDEYGRLVEMNNSDYSFVLELELLYEN